MSDLTERETEVLRQMAQGRFNQAIAETLDISDTAVEKHINALLSKPGLDPDHSTVNRRESAVLTFLRACSPSAADG